MNADVIELLESIAMSLCGINWTLKRMDERLLHEDSNADSNEGGEQGTDDSD